MANPPITIGELTSVPAPGSPIASAWAQDVSRRVVHHFATSAARNAQYANPVNGALAYTTDFGRLCMWDGFGWLILREAPTAVADGSPILTVWPHSNGASSTPIGVAGTWAASATVGARYMRYDGLCHITVTVTLGATGFGIGQINVPFPFDIPGENKFQVAFVSPGAVAPGMASAWGGQSFALFGLASSGNTAIVRFPTSATFPFTFAAGNTITVTGSFALTNPYDQFFANP